ncbi:MAG: SBBP repeat-containing protein, partial [Bryocella sp.]
MRIRTHHPLLSGFIAALTSLLAGCGTGVSSSTNPPTTSYLFPAGAPYAWVQYYGASNLPTPHSITVALETLTGIAADSNGNIVNVGYDLGSMNGSSNPTQIAQAYIVKYDQTGSQKWLKQFGTGSGDFLNGVSVDSAGNIFAIGITHGALPGYSNPNQSVEAILYKFDPDGTLLWQTQYTVDSAYTSGDSISCDPQGNPIVGGVYTPQASPQYARIYIRKFDGATGVAIWTTSIGTNAINYFEKLTTDESGQVYLIGETT